MASCASKPKTDAATTKQTEVKTQAQPNQVTMSEEYKRSLQNVSMSCTRSADVRKIEVEAKVPRGCDLFYSSYGNRNKVAWSDYGDSHCKSVKGKIQANLEQAGYQCETPQRGSASEVKNGK